MKPVFNRVTQIRSAKDTGERLARVSTLELTSEEVMSQESSVYVYPRGQQGAHPFMGFGGSFTEASAFVFSRMSAQKQEEILEAYFDPVKGIAFNLGRIHMGSCDFGLGNWTCGALAAGDMSLSGFSIGKYHELILPFYKRAEEKRGGPFTLMASPWSPPPWMKTKQEFSGDGHLRPECAQAWALHFAKFVQAMRAEGVPIWGVSVQNEPEAAQIWESCIYSAKEETAFVRDHLGPTLRRQGLGDVKILVWDHNRDGMFERAAEIYDDEAAAEFIWGMAYHWYGDPRFEVWPQRSVVSYEDRQKDCAETLELRSRVGFDNVRKVADLRPDKHILFSEGCQELSGRNIAEVKGNWKFGERYGMNIISDLRNGTEGWIDWNLILDENGGPNHVGNTCLAPVICNMQKGTVEFQPPFWFMGHFSKYVRPGAQRVLVSTSRDVLEVVAFLNPDQTMAVIVMNQSEEDVDFHLKVPGRCVQTSAIRRSMNTFMLEP